MIIIVHLATRPQNNIFMLKCLLAAVGIIGKGGCSVMLFPIPYRQSILVSFNHDHSCSPTVLEETDKQRHTVDSGISSGGRSIQIPYLSKVPVQECKNTSL